MPEQNWIINGTTLEIRPAGHLIFDRNTKNQINKSKKIENGYALKWNHNQFSTFFRLPSIQQNWEEAFWLHNNMHKFQFNCNLICILNTICSCFLIHWNRLKHYSKQKKNMDSKIATKNTIPKPQHISVKHSDCNFWSKIKNNDFWLYLVCLPYCNRNVFSLLIFASLLFSRFNNLFKKCKE